MVFTGMDRRPVTATGSIRMSDRAHTKTLHRAFVQEQDQNRRAHAAEVREMIEDFEHKMGWKMRKNLGPSWSELRAMELEEERTMGLKRQKVPRPPSPSGYYDYQLPGSPPAKDPFGEPPLPFRPMTGSPDSGFYGNEMGTEQHYARPSTAYDSIATSTVVTRNQPGLRTNSAMSSRQSVRRGGGVPIKGSQELWTSHTMLEPIFMPSSASLRITAQGPAFQQAIADKFGSPKGSGSGSPGYLSPYMDGDSMRGSPKYLLGGASRPATSHFGGRMSKLQAKHNQALFEAQKRREPFASAKIFAEERMLEQMKNSWSDREKRRLRLGMDKTELQAEAAFVISDTADFEKRLIELEREKQIKQMQNAMR